MPQTAPLPLYLRLAETISRDIAAGRLQEGERLPPERQMAAQAGVALGTMRAALAELAQRGLVERRQGSGNYIRARHSAEGIYALFRLEHARLGAAALPTARVLSVELGDKPRDLPRFGEGTRAHRIRRLRLLAGEPAELEEIWLCASYAPRLDGAALSESLYLHYRRQFGLNITRAIDEIGQEPVPDWSPDSFPVAVGTALPMVLRMSLTEAGECAEVSRNWFDPRVARYVTRLP